MHGRNAPINWAINSTYGAWRPVHSVIAGTDGSSRAAGVDRGQALQHVEVGGLTLAARDHPVDVGQHQPQAARRQAGAEREPGARPPHRADRAPYARDDAT